MLLFILPKNSRAQNELTRPLALNGLIKANPLYRERAGLEEVRGLCDFLLYNYKQTAKERVKIYWVAGRDRQGGKDFFRKKKFKVQGDIF